MAYPSVTHSFTNGTTASATQVNQNFTDLINGFSDSTKDFSMNAGTLAGAFTANGHCTLGNAAADDLTINASLASSLAIKANNTYNIGGATLGLAGLYLGAPSARSTRLTAHQSLGATNTLVLPNGNGNSAQLLSTDGSGNLSWAWGQTFVPKNDDYVVLDTDGYGTIAVTVINKTITLPTAADNTNRVITIIKDVSGNGTITIKGEAAGETVDGITGTTGITLDFYKESVTLVCTGTVWKVLSWSHTGEQYDISGSVSGDNGWTESRAVGFIQKTRGGVWRIAMNLQASMTSTATLTLTFSGISFQTSSYFQVVTVITSLGSTAGRAYVASSSTIDVALESAYDRNSIMADLELSAKPTVVV